MIKNKENKFISAIVYVHNNENEIGQFLENIYKELNSNFLEYEIICVNDGSIDDSVLEIQKVSKKFKNTVVSILNIGLERDKYNKELSMKAGIDLSIGDYIYEFDNINLDCNLDVIVDAYKKIIDGYDIVNVRSSKKEKISSRLFYSIFNKYSNNIYKLNTESFRIVSRRAINRVETINKFLCRKIAYITSGLQIGTIIYNPVRKIKTINGNKKYERSLAIDSILLFTNLSYKVSILITMIMILSATITGGYTLLIFVRTNSVNDITAIISLASFAFFFVFLILTIIIKLLKIIIDLLFKKQDCIIESIRKITT